MSGPLKFGASLLLPWLSVALIAQSAEAQSDEVVGIWNLETRTLAQRATGGVRKVLLRIEHGAGGLEVQMTSPRATYLDVQEFRYGNGAMFVAFGAYEYSLYVDGDRVTGTMFSPLDTLTVTGTRQEGTLFVGDEPAVFRTTRTAILGHRKALAPPREETDPVGWVSSRIDSVEDLALIVRGHAVSFTNAVDFGEDLLAYAGQRVRVTGVWVGEQIQIEVLAPARPGSR